MEAMRLFLRVDLMRWRFRKRSLLLLKKSVSRFKKKSMFKKKRYLSLKRSVNRFKKRNLYLKLFKRTRSL